MVTIGWDFWLTGEPAEQERSRQARKAAWLPAVSARKAAWLPAVSARKAAYLPAVSGQRVVRSGLRITTVHILLTTIVLGIFL